MTGPARRRRPTLGLVLAAAMVSEAAARAGRPVPAFRFERDTFAFANETVWEYRLDAAPGRTAWRRREPPAGFVLRCGNMARAARQFRLHARFSPGEPAPDPAMLRVLVRAVLARDPRVAAPSPDPVTVPGYAGLRALSAAHEALFKEALGGAWHSYMQRGNWRMIFPFFPSQQAGEARGLGAALERGETPIVHVLRFPSLTLNHVLLLYEVEATPDAVNFRAYDPNDPETPLTLRWDRGGRTFVYPRTAYFGGGPVRAYAIYDGLLR